MIDIPRLMIAAPASGSGKSMIASGLMAALSKTIRVQGFKVGPDYIDPMYHTAATGRPSRNLDTWMLTDDQVRRIFVRASRGANLSVIEGVMGFFDGYGSDPFLGSSASVAHLLRTPVILVLDCSKMSGSAAAVVHGFNTFCQSISIAGVICNRVGSESHCKWLTEAIEKRNAIPVLGCIPHLAELHIPERHLGLFTVPERIQATAEFLDRAARILERYIDLNRIMNIARSAESLADVQEAEQPETATGVRLAVAQDEAFCFYYEDNLDALRQCGAEIVPFSPLNDRSLPEGTSGIYFGGGYPELYAAPLSLNESLRGQVLACCRKNMPVYAECGGLMYLAGGVRIDGAGYLMAGAIPGWCEMGERLNMGYREVETLKQTLLAEKGATIRGHEFHYSRWEPVEIENCAYRTRSKSENQPPKVEGYSSGNILASYVHLHFAQEASLAQNFVRRCRDWQKINPPPGEHESE